MSLLIDIRDPGWMEEEALKEVLQPLLPGVRILCGDPGTFGAEVKMLAVISLYPGVIDQLPNLQLVQKLGAGVDGIVGSPEFLSHLRVTRLKPDAPAQEIAEYFVTYVLQFQRHVVFHQQHQQLKQWEQKAPLQSPHKTVGVLGLGHIGKRTAQAFSALGFQVLGWSRSLKRIDQVQCYAGDEALSDVLARCDYVACILPSTEKTTNLFDKTTLRQIKPGAVLLNAGRGDLIVEQDLIAVLDEGHLSAAVLDVFQTEPLPVNNPLWDHPKITLTPHVSGWHVDEGLSDIADNYRRLVAGDALLHEVDVKAGY